MVTLDGHGRMPMDDCTEEERLMIMSMELEVSKVRHVGT